MAARGARAAAGDARDRIESLVAAFHQGLSESGYVEGQNLAVEYRWADGDYERLPTLAADLVGRRVSAIFADGPPAVVAAKAATSTIPIVFTSGGNPVELSFVSSLSPPGGNVTGVSFLVNELGAKRLELLRELVPTATSFGFLANPTRPKSSLAKVEAQKISERTRAGTSQAKAKGVKIGRPRLAAELRHEITRRAATGETAYAIAKALHIDRHTAAKYLQSQ